MASIVYETDNCLGEIENQMSKASKFHLMFLPPYNDLDNNIKLVLPGLTWRKRLLILIASDFLGTGSF